MVIILDYIHFNIFLDFEVVNLPKRLFFLNGAGSQLSFEPILHFQSQRKRNEFEIILRYIPKEGLKVQIKKKIEKTSNTYFNYSHACLCLQALS